jgi:aminoglycoside phosphotransferase family enzyme
MTDAGPTTSQATSIDTAAKVSFLLRRAFPKPPESIETHLSWVFLTPNRAYKLKKPVQHPFLDHRSIENRQRDCEAEVALNRGLAPGIYLDVVPLSSTGPGELVIGGDGPAVDWLVVMRRIPNESFLDRRLSTDPTAVTDEEMAAIIEHLAEFYRTTGQRGLDDQTHRWRLADGLAEDRAELLRHDHALEHDLVIDLADRLQRVIADSRHLAGRSARIVDGHGDLRPEHIVLSPRPLVIDRITFDEEIRRIDPAADLALLEVECRRFGAGAVGSRLAGGVLKGINDTIPASDRAIYRALRAVTRARLSIAHLADGDHHAGRWLDRTDDYLALAIDELDLIGNTVLGEPSGGDTPNSSHVEVEQLGE